MITKCYFYVFNILVVLEMVHFHLDAKVNRSWVSFSHIFWLFYLLIVGKELLFQLSEMFTVFVLVLLHIHISYILVSNTIETICSFNIPISEKLFRFDNSISEFFIVSRQISFDLFLYTNGLLSPF